MVLTDSETGRPFKVVTESLIAILLVAHTTDTGVISAKYQSTSGTNQKRLNKNIAIRNVAVQGDEHVVGRLVYVQAGDHEIINALPDLQGFATSPHTTPETAPKCRPNDDYIFMIDLAGNIPSANKNYVAAISYWEIEYL